MYVKYIYSRLAVIAVILFLTTNAHGQTDTFNFYYTGAAQTWTVPPCVSSVTVDVQGATGGLGGQIGGPHINGGSGGRVRCTLAVTPGDVLQIFVGGQGDSEESATWAAGGFNGGGAGANEWGSTGGGGGGGASDIRVSPYDFSDALVVAAGGGGGGIDCAGTGTGSRGGNGGGLYGGQGYDCGSLASTLCGGGAGPSGPGAGGFYTGLPGAGTPGRSNSGGSGESGSGGGGGGGGYYGGGGGDQAGGGGGCSYTNPTHASSVVHTTGYNSFGNGIVTIITPSCNPPGVITGADSICLDSTITLTSNSICGAWSSDNPSIATVSSGGVVTGVAAGVTIITYSVPNPCGGVPATLTIHTKVCVNGVSNVVKDNDVVIFPNPANNKLIVKTGRAVYNALTISSSVGQALIRQAISSKNTIVNLEQIPAGMYYITLHGDNGNAVRPFWKE